MTTSSSTRLWSWMAKSMPTPSSTGRPEIVTTDKRDAEVAGEPERPDEADDHDAERQQAPADVEEQHEDDRHQHDGDGAEGQEAALEVVVDVLEQHRRARREDRCMLDVARR